VVVRGRAKFTVGEEQADGPAGTVVFVPPEVERTAVAEEDDTVVLAVGGVIGEPFEGGNWEAFAVADALRREGRSDEGRAVLHKELAERPDSWAMNYNAGCWEALAGNPDAAFGHLLRAKELNPDEVRPYFESDSDLDPLRDDPRWQELAA
jgi:hypothetical protein